MPYKLFTAGSEGLASDVNTYLMNQSVMVFADATARDAALTAPTEGMMVYLTSNDHYMLYSGTEWIKFDTVWNAWTPTITGLTQGTGAVTQCYYARIGKTIVAQGYITLGTGPTGISTFTISLPVDHANSNRSIIVGQTFMRDSVAARSYTGFVSLLGSAPGTIRLFANNASATYTYAATQTATVPHAWTSGDYFSFTIMYQGV